MSSTWYVAIAVVLIASSLTLAINQSYNELAEEHGDGQRMGSHTRITRTTDGLTNPRLPAKSTHVHPRFSGLDYLSKARRLQQIGDREAAVKYFEIALSKGIELTDVLVQEFYGDYLVADSSAIRAPLKLKPGHDWIEPTLPGPSPKYELPNKAQK